MKTTILVMTLTTLALACQEPVQAPSTEKAKTESVAEKPKVDSPKKKTEITPKSEKAKTVFPSNMKTGERLTFGSAFTIKSEPITLSAALSAGASEKTQKISGHISKVCKAKGCWFTLKHEKSPEVRVKMKDYGFFVPKNADGGEAIVEGVLSQRILPQKEAQHYADDAVKAGEKAKIITKDERIFELVVSAVEISKPS